MAEKIKRWYGWGLWTAAMVRSAWEKGVLTEAEYQGIIGEG